MNLKEAMEIAKAMEAQYKAFSKISEFLTTVSEFSNTAAKSEKKLLSLKREIDEMEAKKIATQVEIAKKNQEAIESGEKIIANLKMEAKSIAASVAEAKEIVSKDIGLITSRRNAVTEKMDKEIRELSTTKIGIEKEISELTKDKATLEAEIKSMKEKLTSFLN